MSRLSIALAVALMFFAVSSGKVVQTLPIGPGPDGCVRDVATGLIFASSGGDGTVAVVREVRDGDGSGKAQ